MKRLVWLGDSKGALDRFPESAQDDLEFELYNVQQGERPSDSKPMPSIGACVEEIRVWVESGTYRVVFLARLAEAVYVLHAFQKKPRKTAQSDVALARARLQELLRTLK